MNKPCTHDKRFLMESEITHQAYCTVCAADNWREAWQRRLAITQDYADIRPLMDMHSPPGTKVMFWFPHHGYDHDKPQFKDLGITLGTVLTVEHTEVGSCHAYIFLNEFPGELFNHVNFAVPTAEDIAAGKFVASSLRSRNETTP
jgi:hypothetical protein